MQTLHTMLKPPIFQKQRRQEYHQLSVCYRYIAVNVRTHPLRLQVLQLWRSTRWNRDKRKKVPFPLQKKKKMKGQHISFIQVREDKDRALWKKGSVWKCLSVHPLWWWSQINRWNVSILSPLTSLKSAALSCFLEFSLWIFLRFQHSTNNPIHFSIRWYKVVQLKLYRGQSR